MTEFLNPYHEWLGIGKKNLTPHHYELLGIALYESDLSAIALAADKRITLLREQQHGPHAELVQNLIAEVVHARNTLLDADTRQEYETTISAELKSLGPPPLPEEIEPAAIGDSTNMALGQLKNAVVTKERQEKRGERNKSRSRRPAWFVWLTAATLAALAAAGTFIFLRGADDRASRPTRQVASPLPIPKADPTQTPDGSGLNVPEPVDLLALVDPIKHTLVGKWKRNEQMLEMQNNQQCMLILPYAVPQEYRLSMQIERIEEGVGTLRLLLPHQDRFLFLSIETNRAAVALDGDHGYKNEFNLRKRLLEPNRKLDVVVDKSEGRVRVAFDREQWFDWEIDSDRLVLPEIETRSQRYDPRNCVMINNYKGRFSLHSMFLAPRDRPGERVDIDFDSAITFNGHCYKRITRETHTWRQAVATCEEMGGHLVCIETAEELDFLKKEILHHRPTWIGAMRPDKESPYRWINGAEMNFAHWWKDVEERLESYLMCDGNEALWRDRQQSSRMAFVCEWNSPQPVSKSENATSFLATLKPKPPTAPIEVVQQHAGHTYAIIDERMSWHDARSVCEQMGGYLCCIESEEEEDFINGVIGKHHRYWLGGTDLAQEGEWRWLTGKPLKTDRWRKDDEKGNHEPNNLGYRGAEHFLKMYLPGNPGEAEQLWIDNSGKELERFICEWDSEQVAFLDRVNRPNPKPLVRLDPKRQESIAAELLKDYESKVTVKSRRQRATVAAHWIELAKNEQEPNRKFVLLDQASKLAANNTNIALAMAARDEIDRQFESEETETARIQLLQDAAIKVQSVWDVNDLLTATSNAIRDGQVGQSFVPLGEIYATLEKTSRKIDPRFSSRINSEKEIAASVAAIRQPFAKASERLQQEPNDAVSHRTVGEFIAIVRQDWDTAMDSLSKSGAGAVAQAAAQCKKAGGDYNHQLAMATAWWNLADETKGNDGLKQLRENAAMHWYVRAYPRATQEDRKIIETRLGVARKLRRNRPTGAFAIPTSGLAGTQFIVPTKSDGEIMPRDGFATINGNCALVYPVLLTPEFALDLDIELYGDKGELRFRFGRHEGCKLHFPWSEERKGFIHHLHHYNGGWWSDRGSGKIPTGKKLSFTVFQRSGYTALYQGDQRLSVIDYVGGEDLALRIGASDLQAKILRCELRPLSHADPVKPVASLMATSAEGDVQQRLLHDFDFASRPNIKNPEAFQVETTNTPMQWIPAGKFVKQFGKNGPKSEIVISRGFWMGRYEFTQEEWWRLTRQNPSRTIGSRWLPVDGVSWTDVARALEEFNKREQKVRRIPQGYVYRLPTEMEWEYACRAGVPASHSVPVERFWHRGTAKSMQPVGTSQPNKFGLYDMHGNVMEWCLDAFKALEELPPAKMTDPVVSPGSDTRIMVARGAEWWRRSDDCRSDSRYEKENVAAAYRGFRIVLAPKVGN